MHRDTDTQCQSTKTLVPMHQDSGADCQSTHQFTDTQCIYNDMHQAYCTPVSYPTAVKAPRRRGWMDGSLGSHTLYLNTHTHTRRQIWQSAGVSVVRNLSPPRVLGAPGAVYGPMAALAWGYYYCGLWFPSEGPFAPFYAVACSPSLCSCHHCCGVSGYPSTHNDWNTEHHMELVYSGRFASFFSPVLIVVDVVVPWRIVTATSREARQIKGDIRQWWLLAFQPLSIIIMHWLFTVCKTNREYCRGTEAH